MNLPCLACNASVGRFRPQAIGCEFESHLCLWDYGSTRVSLAPCCDLLVEFWSLIHSGWSLDLGWLNSPRRDFGSRLVACMQFVAHCVSEMELTSNESTIHKMQFVYCLGCIGWYPSATLFSWSHVFPNFTYMATCSPYPTCHKITMAPPFTSFGMWARRCKASTRLRSQRLRPP
jgi:hypothetical protein